MKNIVSISNATYQTFADLLVFNLDNRDYLSDSISVVEGDIEITLSFSIVAHYSKSLDEETYGREVLSDISPVWWNCETLDNGAPVNNDFSFDELKTRIIW